MAEDRAYNNVRVVDPRKHDNGTSYATKPGERLARRDNNESGPMIGEKFVQQNRAISEAHTEKRNARQRAEGKTPVIKINSAK
jgi:hypothetical protein